MSRGGGHGAAGACWAVGTCGRHRSVANDVMSRGSRVCPTRVRHARRLRAARLTRANMNALCHQPRPAASASCAPRYYILLATPGDVSWCRAHAHAAARSSNNDVYMDIDTSTVSVLCALRSPRSLAALLLSAGAALLLDHVDGYADASDERYVDALGDPDKVLRKESSASALAATTDRGPAFPQPSPLSPPLTLSLFFTISFFVNSCLSIWASTRPSGSTTSAFEPNLSPRTWSVALALLWISVNVAS